jgi:hypothetical protein
MAFGKGKGKRKKKETVKAPEPPPPPPEPVKPAAKELLKPALATLAGKSAVKMPSPLQIHLKQ